MKLNSVYNNLLQFVTATCDSLLVKNERIQF